MSAQKTRIIVPPIPNLGDGRINRLLQKARKKSFSRLMATEPTHVKLPIPASILLTSEGEIYIFVFTVRNGEDTDQTLYAKTAEMFGPLDTREHFSLQIKLRYGWADVQDYEELKKAYEKMDSLDVAFYYMLDLRDLMAAQQNVLRAISTNDMDTLQKLCPPWQMA